MHIQLPLWILWKVKFKTYLLQWFLWCNFGNMLAYVWGIFFELLSDIRDELWYFKMKRFNLKFEDLCQLPWINHFLHILFSLLSLLSLSFFLLLMYLSSSKSFPRPMRGSSSHILILNERAWSTYKVNEYGIGDLGS